LHFDEAAQTAPPGQKEDCPTLSQRPFPFDEVGELSVSLRPTLNDDASGDILF